MMFPWASREKRRECWRKGRIADQKPTKGCRMEKVDAKYVFLDVIRYTEYSIEEQFDIVNALKEIVKGAVSKTFYFGTWMADILYLSTGDGICVIMVNETNDDKHLQLALNVIESIFMWNGARTPTFAVRIGINENKDIVYDDINGRRNFAGRGINYAQRVMSAAEANQIFLGAATYEKLADVHKYKGKFREYSVTTKHDKKISVFQFIDSAMKGLNCDPPT
jgi:hypothetical protein